MPFNTSEKRNKYHRDNRKKHKGKLSDYTIKQITKLATIDNSKNKINSYLPKLHREGYKRIIYEDFILKPIIDRELDNYLIEKTGSANPSDIEIEKLMQNPLAEKELKQRIETALIPHKSTKKLIFVNIDLDSDTIMIFNDKFEPLSYTDTELKEIKQAILYHKKLPNINYTAFIFAKDLSGLNNGIVKQATSINLNIGKRKSILYSRSRKGNLIDY